MSFVFNSGKTSLPHRSLLAMCICAALPVNTAFAAPQSEDTVLVEASASPQQADESQDYSVKTTRAGTKMMMVQRDIPQSVSVVSEQRMQDQKLQTLGDVLSNTTGISASVADSDRISYYSRGFLIDNYMVDGIPTFYETRWNLGDSLSDTADAEKLALSFS